MCADEPPVPLPITGELDLHTFRPSDVGELIPAYLAECLARRIFSVRIVHGKGTGALRETVHALLRRSPLVQGFHLGDETSGGWGATIATLRHK
jgi:dsDNA-specific endonuclease/ATPase MutS2